MNRARGARPESGATADTVTAAARPALPPTPELAQRLGRSPLVVALDIDGTLAPLASTPGAAEIPAETRALLTALAQRRNVHLAFVTGRAAPDGRRLADVPNSWVIGNHGMELIDPAGAVRVNLEVEPYSTRVARAFASLRAEVGDIPGVLLEDKLWTLSIHYRLVDRDRLPELTRIVTKIAAAQRLRLTRGKEVYEMRPQVDVNKGTATLALAKTLGFAAAETSATGAPATGALVGSLFYAGDDLTDEDAFRLLRERTSDAVTVHVGPPVTEGGTTTAAELLVGDTAEMARLLEWIVSIR